MSTDKTPGETVITAYKDAPARTMTAGGVTYAYRELGRGAEFQSYSPSIGEHTEAVSR
jgi:hypothetical protein